MSLEESKRKALAILVGHVNRLNDGRDFAALEIGDMLSMAVQIIQLLTRPFTADAARAAQQIVEAWEEKEIMPQRPPLLFFHQRASLVEGIARYLGQLEAWKLACAAVRAPVAPASAEAPLPLPIAIWCPKCSAPHVDEGEWATRPHKTHQCQSCKHEWRPFPYATVGVPRPASASLFVEASEALAIVEGMIARVEKERGPVLSRGPYLSALDDARNALLSMPGRRSASAPAASDSHVVGDASVAAEKLVSDWETKARYTIIGYARKMLVDAIAGGLWGLAPVTMNDVRRSASAPAASASLDDVNAALARIASCVKNGYTFHFADASLLIAEVERLRRASASRDGKAWESLVEERDAARADAEDHRQRAWALRRELSEQATGSASRTSDGVRSAANEVATRLSRVVADLEATICHHNESAREDLVRANSEHESALFRENMRTSARLRVVFAKKLQNVLQRALLVGESSDGAPETGGLNAIRSVPAKPSDG